MSSEASRTVKSLEGALQSNLLLQAQVARRIQAIAQKKASNRRLASRVTSQIVSTWDEIDALKTPPAPIIERKKGKKRRKKDNHTDEFAVAKEAEPTTKYSAKWNYDPYRKWTRRFFVDPAGNTPAPNEDVVKRRKLEEGKFFHHTSPPWSKKEVDMLLSIVAEKTTGTNEEGVVNTLDFDQVASSLEERMKIADKNRPATVKPRSGVDCRLKYADTRQQPQFTKDESMKILEQVHLHNGAPPWSEVATSVNRSPWQCLTAYRTRLSSSRSLPFTPTEDELLLKAVAAMGPQAVLNISAAADLAARFFPNRSPKQLLGRMTASLVNPNNTREVWSDEEERRLMLCMKVYRDTPYPLSRAVAHFPDRASKSVTEKWDRSLNPEFSTKPFTLAEDQTLLEAVRQSPEAGWAELAGLFTSRHPRSLDQRWRDIATEQDLLLKYGTKLKQQGARRGLVKSDGLLSSDDFVVRAKQEQEEE